MHEALLVIPVLLFSVVAHEYAHGYAAVRQGDPTAQMLGRLTLNPIKHIDPWMTVMVPLMLWFGTGGRMVFGGAKPVPVNPANYRHYRRGDIIVSLAGIATNLALAVACLAVFVLVGLVAGAVPGAGAALAVVQRMMLWGIWLNLLLAFFNLIPIPPLDGSHVLVHLLPPRMALWYRQFSRYGFLMLLGLLVFVPNAFSILLYPADKLNELALGVARHFALQAPVWR